MLNEFLRQTIGMDLNAGKKKKKTRQVSRSLAEAREQNRLYKQRIKEDEKWQKEHMKLIKEHHKL